MCELTFVPISARSHFYPVFAHLSLVLCPVCLLVLHSQVVLLLLLVLAGCKLSWDRSISHIYGMRSLSVLMTLGIILSDVRIDSIARDLRHSRNKIVRVVGRGITVGVVYMGSDVPKRLSLPIRLELCLVAVANHLNLNWLTPLLF